MAAPESSLRVATLLSAAGGFLDAFTWLAHGGVFANAQTGNVVLLGVFAAAGQWPQAARHLPPILAFLLGVFVAHRLRLHASRRGERRAALPARFPDLPIVLGIAFVAALQSSSFARVEGWAYSSVMTTGNLRRSAEALFGGLSAGREPARKREAAVFATVCATFALGAAAGAFVTARLGAAGLGNAALAAPVALLGLAFLLCVRAERTTAP